MIPSFPDMMGLRLGGAGAGSQAGVGLTSQKLVDLGQNSDWLRLVPYLEDRNVWV